MKRLPPILLYLFTAMVLMAAGVLCLYESPAAQGKPHNELVYGFNLISARPVRQVDRPLELLRRPAKENPGALRWTGATTFGRATALVLPGGAGNEAQNLALDVNFPWHAALLPPLPVIACATSQVSVPSHIARLPALLGRMSREPADPFVLTA